MPVQEIGQFADRAGRLADLLQQWRQLRRKRAIRSERAAGRLRGALRRIGRGPQAGNQWFDLRLPVAGDAWSICFSVLCRLCRILSISAPWVVGNSGVVASGSRVAAGASCMM